MWSVLASAVHKCTWAIRREFSSYLSTVSSEVFPGESG